MGIMRDARVFYRLSFVTTAYEQGVYQAIGDGAASIESIAVALGIKENHEGLRIWLDLGVSIGELARDGHGYRIAGRLSRQLQSPANDAILALLQEIVGLQYQYVRRTPEILREGRLFPFAMIDAPLIARGSRTLEPFVSEAVEEAVPRERDVRLLEIGCGSGIYIRLACQLNPTLTALGLELDAEVAEMAQRNIRDWGLEHRVSVEARSVLDYQSSEQFDIITLHNNIYYFPVDARVDLLQRLGGLLKSGGRLLITTACQGGDPGMLALDLECAMTEGMGVLPEVNGLLGKLKAAGFVDVRSKRLIPFISYYAFLGEHGA